MSYIAGRGVYLYITWTDVNGVVADPTTVVLEWQDPTGNVTTWTYGVTGNIVRDSAGRYHAVIDTTAKPGNWIYYWIATGAVQDVEMGQFYVEPRRF